MIFGLAVIANVQLDGDGGWFWYARLLRSGTRLYSDLGVPFQPLFPLETRWFQQAFGIGWLASRLQPVAHLMLFTGAIVNVARRTTLADFEQAVLIAGVFFFGIHFEAYRFDDYHVLADSFSLISIALLIDLSRIQLGQKAIQTVFRLAILAGLTVSTRLNDGLILVAIDAAAICLLVRYRRPLLMLTYCGVFASVVAAIIILSGDSISSWAIVSVVHASSLKGGAFQLLLDPIRVATSSLQYLVGEHVVPLLVVILFAIVLHRLQHVFRYEKPLSVKITSAGLILLSSVAAAPFLINQSSDGTLDRAFLALGICLSYCLIIYISFWRCANYFLKLRPKRTDSADLVLLAPFGMCVANSLSSAGHFTDLFGPIAILLLVLLAAIPVPKGHLLRSVVITCAGVLAISGAWYRYRDPASWLNYRSSPMFVNRHIEYHPSYGAMIIEDRQSLLFHRICNDIDASQTTELLSMPLPYVNYFCDVRPWNNYIQTWYDTTPKAVVLRLESQLLSRPPKWILYQRQPETLRDHEVIFNHGERLPQRAIDELIAKRLSERRWTIVDQQVSSANNVWELIRTNPSKPPQTGRGIKRDAAPRAMTKCRKPPAAYSLQEMPENRSAVDLVHASFWPKHHFLDQPRSETPAGIPKRTRAG